MRGLGVVSSKFARVYWRQLWADAQSAGLSLSDAIQSKAAAAIANVGTGKTVSLTQGNGRRVEFAVPQSTSRAPSDGATPTDIVELLDRLYQLLDASVAAGNADDPTHFAYVLSKIEAIKRLRSDYRLLRSSKLDLFPIYPFYR